MPDDMHNICFVSTWQLSRTDAQGSALPIGCCKTSAKDALARNVRSLGPLCLNAEWSRQVNAHALGRWLSRKGL